MRFVLPIGVSLFSYHSLFMNFYTFCSSLRLHNTCILINSYWKLYKQRNIGNEEKEQKPSEEDSAGDLFFFDLRSLPMWFLSKIKQFWSVLLSGLELQHLHELWHAIENQARRPADLCPWNGRGERKRNWDQKRKQNFDLFILIYYHIDGRRGFQLQKSKHGIAYT